MSPSSASLLRNRRSRRTNLEPCAPSFAANARLPRPRRADRARCRNIFWPFVQRQGGSFRFLGKNPARCRQAAYNLKSRPQPNGWALLSDANPCSAGTPSGRTSWHRRNANVAPIAAEPTQLDIVLVWLFSVPKHVDEFVLRPVE